MRARGNYRPKKKTEIAECPVTVRMWPEAGKSMDIPGGVPTKPSKRRVYQGFTIQFNKSADIGKIKRESKKNASRAVNRTDRYFGR